MNIHTFAYTRRTNYICSLVYACIYLHTHAYSLNSLVQIHKHMYVDLSIGIYICRYTLLRVRSMSALDNTWHIKQKQRLGKTTAATASSTVVSAPPPRTGCILVLLGVRDRDERKYNA